MFGIGDGLFGFGWLASFLLSFGILLLTFANAITFTLDDGELGVMSESVEQRGDACGVWKDGVPLLEWQIGGEDDRAALFVS